MPNDPLAGWPETFSINTLAALLDIGYDTARKHVHEMPHTNVGFGSKRENLRVSKEDVRARFFPHTLKSNLRIAR